MRHQSGRHAGDVQPGRVAPSAFPDGERPARQPPRRQAESESITSQLQQMSRIYDGRILLIDSSFHIIKDTYDLDTDKTIISEEVIKSFRGEDSMNYDVDNHYVEMTIPLTTDNVESGEKSIIGVLLISVSTDSILANLEYMRNAALVLQIFGAVLLFAVSVFLSVYLVPLLPSGLSMQKGDFHSASA